MGTYSYFCTLLATVNQYSVYWDHPKKKTTTSFWETRLRESKPCQNLFGSRRPRETRHILGWALKAEWNDSSVHVGAVKLREMNPTSFWETRLSKSKPRSNFVWFTEITHPVFGFGGGAEWLGSQWWTRPRETNHTYVGVLRLSKTDTNNFWESRLRESKHKSNFVWAQKAEEKKACISFGSEVQGKWIL